MGACAGRIKSIEVKGIVVISYNFLNLPEKIDKGLQQSLRYIYDATGRKISQEVDDGTGLIVKKTDYEGEFFYQNDTLKFINHEEGRVVMTGAEPEYQYNLKDHLGNVRLTFTTKPEEETFAATFETNTQSAEQADFQNYSRDYFDIFDHTDTASVYTYSQLLNGGNNSQIGLAKSLSVMPGDTIRVEVYAKYRVGPNPPPGNLAAFASALTGAFGLSGSMTGDPAMAYDALDAYGTIIAGGFDHSDGADAPRAYLNILFFDKNYNFVDAAYKQIGADNIQTDAQTEAGIKADHGYLNREIIVPEAGYAFIFLSNENPTQVDVYFDDLKITHAKSPIIQMDDYYPFGLTFNSYQRENSEQNLYQYNGKEKQDELSLNWLDYGARMYMPDIGRWWVVDPMSEKYFSFSPYNYVANNPILFVDPDGTVVEFANDETKTKKENRRDRREFMKGQRELNRKSETAKTNWKTLKGSDNVHTIHLNKTGEDGNIIDNKVTPKDGYTQREGGGTDIYINTKNTTIEGVDLGTNIIGIGHEEGHAFRFDQGLAKEFDDVDYVNDPDAFTKRLVQIDQRKVTEETEASHIENIIRAEVDPSGTRIPLRQQYRNIPQMIDPATGRIHVHQIDVNVIKDGYRYYKRK